MMTNKYTSRFTEAVLDAGLDEIVRGEVDLAAKDLNLMPGEKYMAVSGSKAVTAMIMAGSRIEWNEERGTWVGYMIVRVTKIVAYPPLKLVEP